MQTIARRGMMALVGGLLLAAHPSLAADDQIAAEAREAVSRMSKTLATGAFSFQTRTIRQYEQKNLPLHIVHVAEVTVKRPNHLLVKINGDDGQAEIGFDGNTLIIYSAKANKYVQVPLTGNIETMLRTAAERLGMDFPLADLLAEKPGQAFLEGVVSGIKLDDVTIDGQTCNHFFFMQPPGIELELWTEATEQALPRRIALTYRSVAGEPQLIAELSNWKLGINPPDDLFVIKPPPGAVKTEVTEKSQ